MDKTPRNPYVGPRSFETGEALYGRDREQRALAALLVAERIVLLHSPSGAGKTSLVRAGLMPYMARENFQVLPVIRVNMEPPGGVGGVNRYLLSTLTRLEEAIPSEKRLSQEKLISLSLDDYLNERSKREDDPDYASFGLLLIFDQFEESLTVAPADRDGKLAFFAEVGKALRNKNRWALFSMREDYIGALTPYLRPIPNRLAARFRLDLLGQDAAKQAVQKPALAYGVTFDALAAQKLVDDLRRIQVMRPDGGLESQLGLYVEPVQLQVVCYRLWEQKKVTDKEISVKDLESVGNVNESLASYYADSVGHVADENGTPERIMREWFERKLISADGIRGQVRMGGEATDGLPNAAVRMLENAHIIRADIRAGQSWFELAHDRLIEPVRTDNKAWFKKNLSVFQRQAGLWLERGRSEGLLLRGHELELAEEEIKKVKPSEDEADYLAACRLRKKREERDVAQRRWILIGLGASLVLFVAAVFFSINSNVANANLQLAIKTADAASIYAYNQQQTAEAASANAVISASTAIAASTEAFIQKEAAVKAENSAYAAAAAASAAEAKALAAKAEANAQEQKTKEQSVFAQANSLIAQSLLAELKNDISTATLMATAALQIIDNASTRLQLLGFLYNKSVLYLAQSQPSGQTVGLNFALDGKMLVSNNYFDCKDKNYYLCRSSLVKIWDISSGTNAMGWASVRLTQAGGQIRPPGMLDASAVSPDGKTIAVASCDPDNSSIILCKKEDITFWDAGTRVLSDKRLSVMTTSYNDHAVYLLYSPDGSMLALSYGNPTNFRNASNMKPTLVVWDLKSMQEKALVDTGKGMTQMAFSADGKTLAYVSGESLVLVDTLTLEKREMALVIGSGKLTSMSYSPDGKFLAVGNVNGDIKVLNAMTYEKTGLVMKTFNDSAVKALVYSPDSRTLVSGTFDGGIMYWDAASGSKLLKRMLYKHVEVPDDFPIYSLAFSPDGKMVVSSSDEIILADMSKDSWFAKACSIAGRNMTLAEWTFNIPVEAYRKTCEGFAAGN